jgi:ribosomal-protein-alanine N-acetyltransferase
MLKKILTERLTLRPLKTSDEPAIYRIRSNKTVNKYIDRPPATSLGDAKLFVQRIRKGYRDGKLYYWGIALKKSDHVIGTICVFNISDDRKKAEVGYELLPAYHGKGFMTETLASILSFAESKLGLRKFEGVTHKNNKASSGLLLRFGFKKDKRRKIKDNPNFHVYIKRVP